jgi:hypothetical protein
VSPTQRAGASQTSFVAAADGMVVVVVVVVGSCSIALFLIFIFTYGALLVSGEFHSVPQHMLAQGAFWLLVMLVPAVSFVINFSIMAIQLAFYPTPVDIAVERDR